MISKLIISILACIFIITKANAFTAKYFCNGKINQFFIMFNNKNKTITIGNSNPKKYWTKDNYTFWHSAGDYIIYEYTFKKSYNKLSGELKIKSHHLITSENDWYDYECSISQ